MTDKQIHSRIYRALRVLHRDFPWGRPDPLPMLQLEPEGAEPLVALFDWMEHRSPILQLLIGPEAMALAQSMYSGQRQLGAIDFGPEQIHLIRVPRDSMQRETDRGMVTMPELAVLHHSVLMSEVHAAHFVQEDGRCPRPAMWDDSRRIEPGLSLLAEATSHGMIEQLLDYAVESLPCLVPGEGSKAPEFAYRIPEQYARPMPDPFDLPESLTEFPLSKNEWFVCYLGPGYVDAEHAPGTLIVFEPGHDTIDFIEVIDPEKLSAVGDCLRLLMQGEFGEHSPQRPHTIHFDSYGLVIRAREACREIGIDAQLSWGHPEFANHLQNPRKKVTERVHRLIAEHAPHLEPAGQALTVSDLDEITERMHGPESARLTAPEPGDAVDIDYFVEDARSQLIQCIAPLDPPETQREHIEWIWAHSQRIRNELIVRFGRQAFDDDAAWKRFFGKAREPHDLEPFTHGTEALTCYLDWYGSLRRTQPGGPTLAELHIDEIAPTPLLRDLILSKRGGRAGLFLVLQVQPRRYQARLRDLRTGEELTVHEPELSLSKIEQTTRILPAHLRSFGELRLIDLLGPCLPDVEADGSIRLLRRHLGLPESMPMPEIPAQELGALFPWMRRMEELFFRLRLHVDMQKAMPELSLDERLDMSSRLYGTWARMASENLGGRTPLQAARQPRLRQALRAELQELQRRAPFSLFPPPSSLLAELQGRDAG
jgi:hypothetical protein